MGDIANSDSGEGLETISIPSREAKKRPDKLRSKAKMNGLRKEVRQRRFCRFKVSHYLKLRFLPLCLVCGFLG